MSEPCPRCEGHEAAWIWAQQLRFVTDERDAALARLARVETLLETPALDREYTPVIMPADLRAALGPLS